VQGLVQRTAAAAQPLRQNIDRHAVERDRDEHLLLPGGQPLDFLPERPEQVARFGVLIWTGRTIGYDRPRRRGKRNLATAPRVPSHLNARFDDGELASPRREPAIAAKVIQPAQDRHKRVISALPGEVIGVGIGNVRKGALPAADLEPGSAQ